MNIFFLLPAYNEAENIVPLLEKISDLSRSLGPEMTLRIVVVDDGSSDDTAARVRAFQKLEHLTLLEHAHNKGLGDALRTGLAFCVAHANADDGVVTMDADNTHDPMLVLAMIEQFRKGTDIIIASRYLPGSQETGVPFLRRALSRIGNTAFHILFHLPWVKDYSSGFRMMRASTLITLGEETHHTFFQEQGFACMTELLLNASAHATRFAEVPLILRYDQKKGASKMIPGKTIREYFSLLVHKWSRRV